MYYKYIYLYIYKYIIYIESHILCMFRKAHRPSLGIPASRVVAVDEPSATTTSTTAMEAVPDQKVAAAFHKELLDTCIDMLSRYAHFTSASFPKRLVTLSVHAWCNVME